MPVRRNNLYRRYVVIRINNKPVSGPDAQDEALRDGTAADDFENDGGVLDSTGKRNLAILIALTAIVITVTLLQLFGVISMKTFSFIFLPIAACAYLYYFSIKGKGGH